MLPKRYRTMIVIFLAPALIVYVVFSIYPAVSAFGISLYNWRGVSRQMTFVGPRNYLTLLRDPIMWQALKHNTFFAVAFPVAILLPALLFALGLHKQVAGSRVYRVAFLLPNLMSVAVVAVLWAALYEPQLGPVNAALKLVGLGSLARAWLGDPKVALPALVLPIAWVNIGFYMLVLYAGLLDIPRELYDAAAIEGAYGWKQFWYITLPLLWDAVTIVSIFIVVGALNEFALPSIMTNGGPSRATELMATYMYKLFMRSQYGYGIALGVMHFVLSTVVLVLAYRLMRREAVEH